MEIDQSVAALPRAAAHRALRVIMALGQARTVRARACTAQFEFEKVLTDMTPLANGKVVPWKWDGTKHAKTRNNAPDRVMLSLHSPVLKVSEIDPAERKGKDIGSGIFARTFRHISRG